ncbi:MAG: hypothetical protein R3E63_04445 [Pseudomonadales bacterium]
MDIQENQLLIQHFSFGFAIKVVLILVGAGIVLCTFGMLVLLLKVTGWVVEVPGYTATVLIVLFFGALNTARYWIARCVCAGALMPTRKVDRYPL